MPKPPEPPEPAFHRAARLGDLASLEELLSAGADVNERLDLEVDNGPHLRQLTPLMIAARSIDGATVDTLRFLMAHGADVRAESEGRATAAWYAAGKGGRWPFHEWRHCPDHVERLRFLLDAGLDPNDYSANGQTLLVEACEAGDPARVQLLLERGASTVPTWEPYEPPEDVAEKEEPVRLPRRHPQDASVRRTPYTRYQLPLHCAAESGSADCVRLLLQAGADVNIGSEAGETALMRSGSAEVVEALMAHGADLHATSDAGYDALDTVLRGETVMFYTPPNLEAATALVRAGADVERRIWDMAFAHNCDAVAFLLQHGAQPGDALHAICWHSEYGDEGINLECARIIELLIAAGVDPNQRDEHGHAAMHAAVAGDGGNVTAVRTLLRLGADPEPLSPRGITPLMFAAENAEYPRDAECIRALLAAGSDPRRPDREGKSAIDRAEATIKTWQEICDSPEPAESGDSRSPAERATRHREALSCALDTWRLLKSAERPTR